MARARRDTRAVADRQAQAVGRLEQLLAEAGERRRDLQAARSGRERADLAAAWNAAFAALDAVVNSREELTRWRKWLDATGVVRRLAPEAEQARSLLGQVAAVLTRLPSRGVPIGRLAAGAEFGYHGDFDWGGVRIASAVRHRVNWRPWHYDHLAYEAAASAARPLTPLPGEPAATPRDSELAVAMRRRSIHIEEELTLDALLQDLSP